MKRELFKSRVYENNRFVKKNISISEEALSKTPSVFVNSFDISSDDIVVFPGLVDVHVHLREPGFSYKETVFTGSSAAKSAGYSAICTMPNLNPVPDSLDNLKVQLDIIKKDAQTNVIPFGSLTKSECGKEISELEEMAPYVVGFSDDGKGVQNPDIMREAMRRCKSLGKIVSAHCEVNALLNGGYIHDGVYAKAHGHRGISSESEWRMIERDIGLAAETGCAYHVCHISTKESVELIRQAKKSGVDITCETAPHYLILCDEDLIEDARFKMNPPLRSSEDRDALLEGLLDGTVDMIATDHAPHSTEEKSRGLEKSAMGVVGLETAFPVMYTKLVKNGVISLEKLVEIMSINPARRFGIKVNEFSVYDLDCEYTVNPDDFITKGRATPFAGETVFGKCLCMINKWKEV